MAPTTSSPLPSGYAPPSTRCLQDTCSKLTATSVVRIEGGLRSWLRERALKFVRRFRCLRCDIPSDESSYTPRIPRHYAMNQHILTDSQRWAHTPTLAQEPPELIKARGRPQSGAASKPPPWTTRSTPLLRRAGELGGEDHDQVSR